MSDMTAKESLKHTLFMGGVDYIEDFVGTSVAGMDRDAMENLMDEVINRMPEEDLARFIQKYGCSPEEEGPYYVYTGPMDTRKTNWTDNKAYRKKQQMASTGSIHIVHPEIEMLCRVTDNIHFPGFIITCKDKNGTIREVHVYMNPGDVDRQEYLRVCTSCETNSHLPREDIVRQNYPIPFVDKHME